MNKLNNIKLKKNIFLKNKKLSKPNWIRIKLPKSFFYINKIKNILKTNSLHTVCEEALCPNLPECFNNKTATFMILGNICTRKCPFCAVKKGRPNIIDKNEPYKLSKTVFQMGIKHIVITSVNRDDLKDGGAKHFVKCIKKLRINKKIKIEILVPDFRNSIKYSIDILSTYPPDIFNHNLENVPRLYKIIRPGANYQKSLYLLNYFKQKNPNIPTKSGLMLGLGETKEEIIQVLKDLRENGVNMLTLGQYLQPSKNHISVKKYITIEEFQYYKNQALSMGFTNAFCGPLVRSSYHANKQIK
ncbi:lipoyl synthase [Buchnera aphidicola]|uniref:Lipoyl synthase n=1 Tax=Buchnera aphidicola (Therioaphis trifolii) TaxID=1241884 RepID=A0A4D6YG67_9GAMM|nr:lipoyl synthase [Buchnera aphidicola]QCI27183.1 lipoyl synthase [Buchnera aphidicola (Therioaphis trifolii)]